MKLKRKYFSFALLLLFALRISAQHSLPDTISAVRMAIKQKIVLDGKLNDTAWVNVPHISNFTQRELNFGEPCSEKTEVAIAYDHMAMYIGVWAYMKDPKKIIAKYMQRDFDYDTDDNFQVLLSPFNDKRNGYLYIINPNGARADMLIYGGEDGNQDWNGVWDCRTTRNDSGWFAEIRIPFTSLQFKRDSLFNWAINFERDIQSKNEKTLWQGWSRDYSIYAVVNAGTISGIKNIGHAKHFEFKPYALGGASQNRGENTESKIKFGGDININVSPTLKLNLTTNTDFAQVEADRIAVNLTRFNLYYPEKREFFLEGYNNYQFYLGNGNEAFYTRKIGIENLKAVPVWGGARLFGKEGKNNFGLLNIVTGGKDSVPLTNNSVFRYKRDLGGQSYIGCMFTSKLNNNISNQVYGMDGSYTTNKFLKKRNFIATGLLMKSITNNFAGPNSLSYRAFIDYPNDLIDYFMGVSSVQKNFDPELGFLSRSNFESFSSNFRFTPRWFTKFGVRKLQLKPWEFTIYRTQTTKEIESWYNESRPVGINFKSGETFQLNLQQSFDRLDQPFFVTDSVSIPVGKYNMQRTEFYFSTFQARRIWAELRYNWGTYYSGNITNFYGSCGINVNKHFNIRTTFNYNLVSLPGAKVTTNELANYIVWAFNPKTDISLFSQWNSFDDVLRFNLRFHWIPTVGQDLYVVYNQGYDKLNQLDILRPQTVTGVAKFVYRIMF